MEAQVPGTDPKNLTPEESEAIQKLHRQAREIIQAIGQAEVHKAKLLSQLADVEDRAHTALDAVGTRLGIPKNTPWHLTQDGSVVLGKTPATVGQ